ncbi:MAG: peptide chain release factor N(5)-glutamine methyltransferase [Clostridia bacterium]|nr:peptide chain release factor N(5)-glutamine methyltransferase [Clostridia bacterium]
MKVKKCNRTSIGGQAVLEGVMMRGYSSMATAVRDSDGVIRVETERVKPVKERSVFFRVPVIRGMINFFTSLVSGMRIMMRSAEVMGDEDGEPSKFEKWLAKTFKVDVYSVVMFIGVALGLALAVGLFIVAPQYLTKLLNMALGLSETSVWFNLIEGGIRILIFISYLLLVSLMKDIRRTFMYHGAEHKTISCYEYGWDLTVENVRKASRVHDRCGTTFMFFVMTVSILVFSLANYFIGAQGLIRILVKIALLPLVAGLSYELLKLLAKSDFFLLSIFKAPGLLLQRITTKAPTDDMIECAITAFNTVLQMDADKSIEPKRFVMATAADKLVEDVKTTLSEGGVTEPAEAEWIVSLKTGIKRSDLSTAKTKVPAKTVDEINKVVAERLTGRPLWYVLGNTDFYGFTFNVDERVLIPRPETEELVAEAIKYLDKDSVVLDMCTGSGAIAVAVQKTVGCKTYASDISEGALEVAKNNADQNGADVQFISGDLFENVKCKFDMIISNPPYIRTDDLAALDKELSFEPSLALDGGADGLDFYRRIASDAARFLKDDGMLLLEIGYDQKDAVIDLLRDFSSVTCLKDLSGNDRIIKAVK